MMTHEQMVAWLILEGWEYHPHDFGHVAHIMRNAGVPDARGERYGDLVVADRYYPNTCTYALQRNYSASFENATPQEVRNFYNTLKDKS